MFKFNYVLNVKDEFEKECRNYHDFKGSEGLDNKIHPDSSWWKIISAHIARARVVLSNDCSERLFNINGFFRLYIKPVG